MPVSRAERLQTPRRTEIVDGGQVPRLRRAPWTAPACRQCRSAAAAAPMGGKRTGGCTGPAPVRSPRTLPQPASPAVVCTVTRWPFTVNPLASQPAVTAGNPTALARSAPWIACHNATTIGPPSASRAGKSMMALENGAVHASHFRARALRQTRCSMTTSAMPAAERHDRIRREGEAEPQLTRRCRALEDADVPSGLAEGDAGRETADAGADDESLYEALTCDGIIRRSRAAGRPAAAPRRGRRLSCPDESTHDPAVDLFSHRLRNPRGVEKLLRVGGAIDTRGLDIHRLNPARVSLSR